jgi:hypothetical protein
MKDGEDRKEGRRGRSPHWRTKRPEEHNNLLEQQKNQKNTSKKTPFPGAPEIVNIDFTSQVPKEQRFRGTQIHGVAEEPRHSNTKPEWPLKGGFTFRFPPADA